MPRVVASQDLPRLTSTRDTRDRLDLVTEDLFGVTELKADRITYHPGDSPHRIATPTRSTSSSSWTGAA